MHHIYMASVRGWGFHQLSKDKGKMQEIASSASGIIERQAWTLVVYT